MPSKLEALFKLHLRADGLEAVFVEEFRFHDTRKWRFDFADPDRKLAIEIDGGTWGGKSGHNTGTGIARDMEKANEAQRLGWMVLRFDSKMVKSGKAIEYLKHVLGEAA